MTAPYRAGLPNGAGVGHTRDGARTITCCTCCCIQIAARPSSRRGKSSRLRRSFKCTKFVRNILCKSATLSCPTCLVCAWKSDRHYCRILFDVEGSVIWTTRTACCGCCCLATHCAGVSILSKLTDFARCYSWCAWR